MELWEFNACVRAYNRKQREEAKERMAVAWQTASFVGAALAGKLRRLNYYLKDDEKITAPEISKEEFDARLRALKERRAADGTKGR